MLLIIILNIYIYNTMFKGEWTLLSSFDTLLFDLTFLSRKALELQNLQFL